MLMRPSMCLCMNIDIKERRWKTVSWDDHTTPPLCVTVLIAAHTPLPPIIMDIPCTLEASLAELNIELNRAKHIPTTAIPAGKFDEFHARRCNDGPNCGWMEATMLLTVDDHIFNTLCRSNGLGTGKMLPAEIRDTNRYHVEHENEKRQNHLHCWHGCCG